MSCLSDIRCLVHNIDALVAGARSCGHTIARRRMLAGRKGLEKRAVGGGEE